MTENNTSYHSELLELNQDFNYVDEYGRSILHRIVLRSDDIKFVTELATLGANVNIRDESGDAPLHLAATFGHVQIVIELIRLGANINIQNNVGETALHMAALCRRTAVVNELLRLGARLDIQSTDGNTSLHLAARGVNKSNKECMESLMTLDSWLVKNNDGNMPIDILGNYGGVECVLSKAIQVDPSLRIFKDCVASLTYRDRRFIRETLLVLNRSPIPATLFPFIIAKTLEDFYEFYDSDEE